MVQQAVKAFLINQGKILLVQRTRDSAWELPGGIIDAGESAEAALCRELKEELGFSHLRVVRSITTWPVTTRFGVEEKDFQVTAYECSAPDQPIQLSREHTAFAWVPFNQTGDYPMHVTYQRAIAYFVTLPTTSGQARL